MSQRMGKMDDTMIKWTSKMKDNDKKIKEIEELAD